MAKRILGIEIIEDESRKTWTPWDKTNDIQRSKPKANSKNAAKPQAHVPSEEPLITEQERIYLKFVAKHPNKTVGFYDKDKQLKMSTKTTLKIRKILKQKGLLIEEEMTTSNGRTCKLLRPSKKARKFLTDLNEQPR